MSDAEPIHLEVYATFFAGKRVENLKYTLILSVTGCCCCFFLLHVEPAVCVIC